MINISKLSTKLKTAGIQNGGCNINGVVWDVDGVTEIQNRADVLAVILAHDPTPDNFIEFPKAVKAPDFIVSTPPINPDPEAALDEAIAEMERGEGNPKSIALIALSLARYLKEKRGKLK